MRNNFNTKPYLAIRRKRRQGVGVLLKGLSHRRIAECGFFIVKTQ